VPTAPTCARPRRPTVGRATLGAGLPALVAGALLLLLAMAVAPALWRWLGQD
jgi:hypothetical protein